MMGVVYHHQELIKSAEPGNFSYELEGHATKTGMEVVDGLLALWQEQEIISVDMPLAVGDLSGLRYLRKVNDLSPRVAPSFMADDVLNVCILFI